MANVRIILHTSKKLKDNKHPVVLVLTIERNRKYFFIGENNKGFNCTIDQWDFEKNRFRKNFPDYKKINSILDKKQQNAKDIIFNTQRDNIKITFDYFTKEFVKAVKKNDVYSFFDSEIERIKRAGSYFNADIYNSTKKKIKKFCNNDNLKFSDIDFTFLKNFETYCFENKAKPNTVSVYMRTLRSLINLAIRDNLCRIEDYPFRSQINPNGYSLEHLNKDTQKRAITKEQMKAIKNYKAKNDSLLFHSKNIFMFSFYTGGMNFIDLANLKWSNIINDRIEYTREKTGGKFSFKIQPELQKILNYYKNNDSEYILPVFNSFHDTDAKKFNRRKKILKQVNNDLKEIATAVGIDFKITTYVARHTWATLLKNKGVSTSVISEGLGHKTEAITQTYLKKFENSVLDKANKNLL